MRVALYYIYILFFINIKLTKVKTQKKKKLKINHLQSTKFREQLVKLMFFKIFILIVSD